MKIYDAICQQLRSQDSVMTSRKYLATHFRNRYSYFKACQGYRAFETPIILPINAWIKSLWKESLLQGDASPSLLLSSTQTQELWESIIAQSRYPVSNIQSAASLAQEGWVLCQQWSIDRLSNQFKHFNTHAAWQSWSIAFDQQCRTNGWLDNESLVSVLITQDLLSRLKLPKRIFLLGIDELPTLYLTFLAKLQDQGCQLYSIHKNSFHLLNIKEYSREINPKSLPDLMLKSEPLAKVQFIEFDSTEAELHAMAQWALKCWQSGVGAIACAVPQLASLQIQLSNIFQTLWQQVESQSEHQLPVSINTGINLDNHPMIGIALDILGLEERIDLITFSRILRAPWIQGSQSEKSARMQLDKILRQKGELWMLPTRLLAWCEDCPELAKILSRYIETLPEKKAIKPMSQWVVYFYKQLSAFGWSGELTLSNEESQYRERWLALLDEYSGLELVHHKVDYATALQKLIQHSGSTAFQPLISCPRPIQILDLRALSSLYFDQVWAMGLDNRRWPSPAQPNPFIPYQLQRENAIPSTLEQERLRAQQLTEHLMQSAGTVILSYAHTCEEQILSPSPLIKEAAKNTNVSIEVIQLSDLALESEISCLSKTLIHTVWENLSDDPSPLKAGGLFGGGASLLKAQAVCPFKAFAEYRLALSQDTLRLPSLGLSAIERGQLIHQILEKFWRKLGNQSTLNSYSKFELDTLLDCLINDTIEKAKYHRPQLWQSQFTQLEKKRLHTRLVNYLELERKRPAFSVVSVERDQLLTLGALTLKLRMDRVDQLEDGTQLLIDYKTNDIHSCQDWIGDRPTEPQLPLYALSQSNIRSVAFLQLKAEKPGKFLGISAQETQTTGIIPISQFKSSVTFEAWSQLLAHWQAGLYGLSKAFQEGHAHVDPKSEMSCQYCERALLCRIKEIKPSFRK